MTTTILLIRHGQTDWNAQGRWQGHVDIPLNEVGRQQALLLAERLQAWPISAIYCSDLRRAAETAAIIARQLDLEPVVDQLWRERHGGEFQGLTQLEIEERHPQSWARLKQGIVDLPGGESSQALYSRVQAALDELLRRHAGEIVAVVTHGGTLRTVIGYVLNLPSEVAIRVQVGGNTGLTIVTASEDRPPVLERLNDIAHLEYASDGQSSGLLGHTFAKSQ